MARRKRHLVVDTLGLLLVVAVTAASVQDRDAAYPLLERLRAPHRNISLLSAAAVAGACEVLPGAAVIPLRCCNGVADGQPGYRPADQPRQSGAACIAAGER